MSREDFSFCHLCTQSCGLAITIGENGKIEKIRPDQDNPYSWRDFCVKGASSHELLDHPRRIRMPMKRVGDRYVEATYEEAVEDIASRLQAIIDRHGPQSVASYVGNPSGFLFGSILFVDLLMKAIGSHNRFFVGSIDENAAHVVLYEMFGSLWAILQPDIDDCRFFIFVGANPAVSGMNWLDQSPHGWRRVLDAKSKGAQVVFIDPRKSESAMQSTQHIAPLPGSDWALLLGMIKVIFEEGLENKESCAASNGVESLHRITVGCDLGELSRRCDVPVGVIRNLATSFAESATGVVISRTGIGLNGNGTISIWLSHCLNVITGRLDYPGGLYYMPGVLNPMRDIDALFKPSHVPSRLRGLPPIVGYRHLAELPDEIFTPGDGQIKSLIMCCGNPVVTGPDGAELDWALEKLDLLVCIDMFQRESHRHAHWLIPGAHFLERREVNPLLSSFRSKLSVQQSAKVVDMPAGMRYEWEFLRDLALAMDLPLAGKRWLNPLIRLSRRLGRMKKDPYFSFSPQLLARLIVAKGKAIPWKTIISSPHGVVLDREKFGNFWKYIRTPDKKVNLCPVSFATVLSEMLKQPVEREDKAAYPFQLTGRRYKQIMNSWLIETSGKSVDPANGDRIEMNPADCAAMGLKDGESVQLKSATGSIRGIIKVSDEVRPGVVVMGYCWGSRLFSPLDGAEPERIGVSCNQLVSNTDLDPLSWVPRLNGTPVAVQKIP